jgi:hypothetical protein
MDSAGLVKELEVSWDSLAGGHPSSHALRPARSDQSVGDPQLPLGGVASCRSGPTKDDQGCKRIEASSSGPTPTRTTVDSNCLGAVIVRSAWAGTEVGTGPDPGRLGYLREGFLFVKTFPAWGGRIPDRADRSSSTRISVS